jgi:hypothetical protein
MPSILAWLDHDASERDRTLRTLALFRERATRDELGIGGIRDSISDRLFPGTSTIQTRLRYFLFVPWIYQAVEREALVGARAAARARSLETTLMKALGAQEDLDGIFGKLAGGELKRLAASVYWSGLGSWGLRRYPGSIQQYHGDLEAIRQRRRRMSTREDGSPIDDPGTVTWHPGLPSPPLGFPEEASIGINREEAEFLREQVLQRHPGTLLAHLMRSVETLYGATAAPWLHPDLASFRPEHRTLLEHGRLLADLTYGAAVLYNLLLARVAGRESVVGERSRDLANWQSSADLDGLARWDLDQLWTDLFGTSHIISPSTRTFVTEWLRLVRSRSDTLAADRDAERLVRQREEQLKGRERSRFSNSRAREQWGGKAGMVRLNYRWPIVEQLLGDMRRALVGGS